MARPKRNTAFSNTGSVPQALLTRYLTYLRLEKGFSAHTLDAYRLDLQKLLNYYTDEGIDFRHVTLRQLDHFAAWLIDMGLTHKSMGRILSGVRSFYRFLELEREIDTDPTELLESPKQAKHLPEVLSIEEIDAIIHTFDEPDRPESIRDRAIVEVLYSCGLRVSELCALRLSQLYIAEGYIHVHGKGNKDRLVPISPVAVECLREWFAAR